MLKAEQPANAVRRDMRKMKVFVRFRPVVDEAFKNASTGGPLHVAWFEPGHHIVEAIAPFFARRFTQMRWAILTPERCMAWHGAVVCFSPGVQKSYPPPPDADDLASLQHAAALHTGPQAATLRVVSAIYLIAVYACIHWSGDLNDT